MICRQWEIWQYPSGKIKASDVLVRPEGHSQEAVQKPHEQRACQTAEQGDENGRRSLGRSSGLLVEESADDAADAAHIHDAGDT